MIREIHNVATDKSKTAAAKSTVGILNLISTYLQINNVIFKKKERKGT